MISFHFLQLSYLLDDGIFRNNGIFHSDDLVCLLLPGGDVESTDDISEDTSRHDEGHDEVSLGHDSMFPLEEEEQGYEGGIHLEKKRGISS